MARVTNSINALSDNVEAVSNKLSSQILTRSEEIIGGGLYSSGVLVGDESFGQHRQQYLGL